MVDCGLVVGVCLSLTEDALNDDIEGLSTSFRRLVAGASSCLSLLSGFTFDFP